MPFLSLIMGHYCPSTLYLAVDIYRRCSRVGGEAESAGGEERIQLVGHWCNLLIEWLEVVVKSRICFKRVGGTEVVKCSIKSYITILSG